MKHLINYYIRKIYLWRHRKTFKYWWIGLHCTTCGKNVFKHEGDYFCLKKKIWKQVCIPGYISTHYILCKKCTERALGRKLQSSDYYEHIDEDPNGGNYE